MPVYEMSSKSGADPDLGLNQYKLPHSGKRKINREDTATTRPSSTMHQPLKLFSTSSFKAAGIILSSHFYLLLYFFSQACHLTDPSIVAAQVLCHSRGSHMVLHKHGNHRCCTGCAAQILSQQRCHRDCHSYPPPVAPTSPAMSAPAVSVHSQPAPPSSNRRVSQGAGSQRASPTD